MSLLDKLIGAKKSLTIWFNTTVLASLPLLEAAKDYLPSTQAYLTPENFKIVGIAVVVINIILRFKTKTSLSDK